MLRAPRPLGLMLGLIVSVAVAPSLVAGGTAAVGRTAAPAASSAEVVTPADAVSKLMRLINEDRAAAGLVAYQPDARLMSIAAGRAVTMASSGLFSHAGPDGATVFTIIQAESIAWYEAGETIAWDTWPDLLQSADAANAGWMSSPEHRALLLATDQNYFGVGMATAADGKHYWAAEFLRGPDRTGAWARMGRPSIVRLASGEAVRLAWTGGDVPLSVLTAGLRDFQLQRRTDLGPWAGIASATVLRAWTVRVVAGHEYQFRVRARDRAGNYGAWTAVSVLA